MKAVLETDDAELFAVRRVQAEMPEPARIYKSISCASCGEKVMEPRTLDTGGRLLCIPCSEEEE
jgi:formylmethanofuran dehydrogenase subunit E